MEVFAMTKPFVPHVFRALTTSVVHDRTNPRGAVVRFPVDADFYSFVLDHAALARLGRQIERVLREIPAPGRKRRPHASLSTAPVADRPPLAT
jgi:hypothetical protein